MSRVHEQEGGGLRLCAAGHTTKLARAVRVVRREWKPAPRGLEDAPARRDAESSPRCVAIVETGDLIATRLEPWLHAIRLPFARFSGAGTVTEETLCPQIGVSEYLQRDLPLAEIFTHVHPRTRLDVSAVARQASAA